MKRARRPLIGITQGDKRKQTGWRLMCLAIWLAGGKPRLISAKKGMPAVPCDGLVIGGGADVHPSRYGDTPKLAYPYDTERDALEIACFEQAMAKGIPVLGICRGAQLINVARGGTLCMDISKTYEKASYPSGVIARFFYRKPARIIPGSLLEELLGQRDSMVNSMHTQSVLNLGQGLAVTAIEANGIVQAIEDSARAYMLGVQFHPEYLIHRRRFRRIFKALVDQAR